MTVSEARAVFARYKNKPLTPAIFRELERAAQVLRAARKIRNSRSEAARRGWTARRSAVRRAAVARRRRVIAGIRAARSRRLRNPLPGRHGERIGGRMIYGRLLRIEAKKTQAHRCDPECARADHSYYHDFKASSDAVIQGLPDGSLLIYSRAGQRLWDLF